MAEGYNRVFLLGNVGQDPELKVTQGGQAVLKLRIATTERYQDKSGVWQDRTEWHNVVVWGKRAESLHKFLAKGSSVFVEGSLRTSSYDDRDGVKRWKTEVIANRLVLAGRGPSRGTGPSPNAGPDEGYEPPRPPAGRSRPQQAPAPPSDDESSGAPPDDFPVGDDDLPF